MLLPEHIIYMEKIIQFGEGNFLRAFVDWMVEEMNLRTDFDGSVVVVKPRPGDSMKPFQEAGCRYTVCVQGQQDGQVIDELQPIKSISRAINPYEDTEAYFKLAEQEGLRFVVSNTTEAGIQFDASCKLTDRPASSYPAKLTQLLYHRWRHFEGSPSHGLIILPCELILHNGRELTKCVDEYIELWKLEDSFRDWVKQYCPIYSTLVDRIVSGKPTPDELDGLKERTGGKENIFVKAEPYHLWVIEAPATLENELPLQKAGLNVLWTDDETPYHERKLTLLNAPHTAMAALGAEMGLETVRDCLTHPTLSVFLQEMMHDELLPTLLPLGLQQNDLETYIRDVTDRFLNPFLHHRLTSIRLNAISKCKARLLPPIQRYFDLKGEMPAKLTQGLLANIRLEA